MICFIWSNVRIRNFLASRIISSSLTHIQLALKSPYFQLPSFKDDHLQLCHNTSSCDVVVLPKLSFSHKNLKDIWLLWFVWLDMYCQCVFNSISFPWNFRIMYIYWKKSFLGCVSVQFWQHPSLSLLLPRRWHHLWMSPLWF